MNREASLDQLKSYTGKTWDIIVIGGGATGLGIALDSVSRGYKTLLLEKHDFAKGTSSRSTKLVHGGVRYIAQGDLLLVIEALHERGLMLKNAAHLTYNQEFIIPVYTWWDVFMYTVGLKFYDILAGSLSMGKSHFISPEKVMVRLPYLKRENLKGGIVYHDGQFDDARMALALAEEAMRRGGVLLNYFPVTGLIKNGNGQVETIMAKDLITDTEFRIAGKVIINATGVFAEEIMRMDTSDSKHYIKPSQGVHLVLDRSFLGGDSAIMIPKTDDGRVLFAIPWYDHVVVGTTDTPVDNIEVEPVALEKEIEFILHTAQNYLTGKPERKDVLSVFAGLRPLAANPENPSATKEISRRHKIILSESGLLTITGGKWTTYRLMARETIDKAIKSGMIGKRKCVTSDLKLVSGNSSDKSDRLHIYGDNATEIKKMIAEKPELDKQIHPSLPYTFAEIIWICRNEMAVTVEDILARRTRALFLDARVSMEIAEDVAELMANELGKDESWKKLQVEDYKRIAANYI
jgi:glycerol-3-phosphate dehydrogenase